MPKPTPPPADTETVDERIAAATPEQVARAIFAAVAPPDPRKQRPASQRDAGTP